MTAQPEQLLENNLISQLVGLGYERIILREEKDVITNFKNQVEKHNQVSLSDAEFNQILIYINKGNTFERAKTLRSRIPYVNAFAENKTIQLIDQKKMV